MWCAIAVSQTLFSGRFRVVLAAASMVVCFLISFTWVSCRRQPRHPRAPTLVRGFLPYVGCWYQFWSDPVGFLDATRKSYGDVFSVLMGGQERIFVFEKEFIPEFFKTSENSLGFEKATEALGIMVPLVGQIIPKSEIIFHKGIGAGLTNALKRKFLPKVSEFGPLFESEIMSYAKENMRNKGVFQSKETCDQLVARISIRVIFGASLCQNTEFIDLQFQLKNLVRESEQTMRPGWPFIRRRAKKIHKRSGILLEPVISELRRWQQADPDGWLKAHNVKHLLGIYTAGNLPENPEKLAKMDKILASQILGFNFASLFSTPQALEGVLVRILCDNDLHHEVESQIHDGLLKFGEGFTARALKEMPLLVACFYEYNRMEAFPTLARAVKNEHTLPSGTVLPANSLVFISPKLMMDEDADGVFSNPSQFNPYRMMSPLDELSNAAKSFMFPAFGYGLHKCVGRGMAVLEAQLVLGSLIQHYELNVLPGEDGISWPGTCSFRSGTGSLVRSVSIRYAKRDKPLGVLP